MSALDDRGQLDAVLDRIGTGSAPWVNLAPFLAKGADGAAAEGIGIELARALPRNPAVVLRLLTPDGLLALDRVCGIPFIEPTNAFVAAYRRRAVLAVSRIRTAALLDRKRACLARLRS